MIRGIISATTAMRAQVLNQEVIANNLANVATPAYEQDRAVFGTFHDVLIYRFEPFVETAIGGYTGGSVIQDVKTIHAKGPAETTGNPLDIYLPDGTYLGVETPSGTRYTRRGDLEVSPDGYLMVGGYRVLGASGPVRLEGGKNYSISEDGLVLAGGEEVGALNFYTFSEGANLVKEGNSLFRLESGTAITLASARVIPGALEKSSVDPVSEMVRLISAMRTYEAAQRVLHSHDETLEQAINRVGRVS
ncbi:MAG: flagellar hook-basal body protein [Candidatus Fermentithermobacillus carboniphilus]|uniref:Flagellar hook-basal body protein n=1 Tax=Candidatus Fermentithermobacillus carboniphilus TaxID=3085328 RepID=A0AAT9LC80_9FIRM|nr:MAG: flagellar hook-basal body protein [Candidatus Fermentithermobacillus carboniphilus]